MCIADNNSTQNLDFEKEPKPVLESNTDEINKTEQTVNDILEAINLLDSKFDLKLANDEWKNQKYDEMHNRMLEYQNDVFAQIANPLLKSFIQLADSITKDIHYYEKNDTEDVDVVDLLKDIVEQIDAVLYSYDVELYNNSNEYVNTKEQRINKIIETDDPKLDKKVAGIVQNGYVKNNKIFRMQKVNIYKHKESVESE